MTREVGDVQPGLDADDQPSEAMEWIRDGRSGDGAVGQVEELSRAGSGEATEGPPDWIRFVALRLHIDGGQPVSER